MRGACPLLRVRLVRLLLDRTGNVVDLCLAAESSAASNRIVSGTRFSARFARNSDRMPFNPSLAAWVFLTLRQGVYFKVGHCLP